MKTATMLTAVGIATKNIIIDVCDTSNGNSVKDYVYKDVTVENGDYGFYEEMAAQIQKFMGGPTGSSPSTQA